MPVVRHGVGAGRDEVDPERGAASVQRRGDDDRDDMEDPREQTMTDYVVKATLKDVGQGDAEDMAQDLYDQYAEELDADKGEFFVRVLRTQVSGEFDTGWEPKGDPEGVR
jgi:hypothetical protein